MIIRKVHISTFSILVGGIFEGISNTIVKSIEL